MNTVLVVGSNSFSGSTFVDYALQQDSRVLGASRSAEPNDAFLPYKWCDHTNFSFYHLDLNRDHQEITALLHDT